MIPLLLALAASAGTQDDRRLEDAVLQTRGRKGAVVVLWPRVIPATDDADVKAAAGAIQRRIDEAIRKTAPMAPRVMAPAPQRVCPRGGCREASVGVLIGHQDGGCVAVALVNPPGESPTELVPLAGDVELRSPTVPFRAPPEEAVIVRDLLPCTQIAGSMDEAKLVAAVRRWVSLL
ncbi:MAG: hypothetical protein H6736_17660 [Alphaproteobacteria bacterium]|nr:hypothetical protein [Alphaproteobacteria bacterium]